jgi:hypothetical protein
MQQAASQLSGKVNLLEPFEDLPEPFILPECGFQIVLRFQSHHRQFTPYSTILRNSYRAIVVRHTERRT